MAFLHAESTRTNLKSSFAGSSPLGSSMLSRHFALETSLFCAQATFFILSVIFFIAPASMWMVTERFLSKVPAVLFCNSLQSARPSRFVQSLSRA